MGTRLDPTANERTAYIDSLCQILTYVPSLKEVCAECGGTVLVGREQELYTDVCVVGRRVLVTENKGQAQGHKHVPNLVPLEGGDVTRGNP